jgi:3',5'-cyclic AMP phosphodiesterase CpdA
MMANYSFDYADAHFLCLDSNVYVDPTDTALQSWIKSDINSTDAAWKVVVYHHPAFNAGREHYSEQHMRALSPLFEELGVDIVLHGHEHTYQRTRPIRFEPTVMGRAVPGVKKTRLVPGKFTIDRKFDGKSVTKPDGILYIVTGAGGKHLYDPESNANPKNWLHAEDDNADYVMRFISDRHSLSVFDMDHRSLHLTQIDEWGGVIDRCLITKS